MGLIYFGVRVTDLDRSLRFYVQGLGLGELVGDVCPMGAGESCSRIARRVNDWN